MFLKNPETFRTFFGCYNSLYTFGTPRFSAIKLRNLLGFSCIKNMLKGQLLKTSGSQFDNWLFGREEPFIKLPPVYSVKLVFPYVVKGIKNNLTVKFRASRRLRFKDTKRICHPKCARKSSENVGTLRNWPQGRGIRRCKRNVCYILESMKQLKACMCCESRRVFVDMM